MRFFVSTLTIFAIFTLSLECGMSFCPIQSAQASESVPCHIEPAENNHDASTMLLSDCMGVDFFMNNATKDIQPNQSVDTFDFAWIDLSFTYSFESKHINGIRGPPSTKETRNPSQPLYLTTQRFRL